MGKYIHINVIFTFLTDYREWKNDKFKRISKNNFGARGRNSYLLFLSPGVCCLIYLHRVKLKRNKTQRLFALLCIFIFMENKIPMSSK